MEIVLILGLNGLMEIGDVDYSINVINVSCLEEFLRCFKIMEWYFKLMYMLKILILIGCVRCILKRLVYIMVYVRFVRNYYYFVKLIGCVVILFLNEFFICILMLLLLKKKYLIRRRFYIRYWNLLMLWFVDVCSSGYSIIKWVFYFRKFD